MGLFRAARPVAAPPAPGAGPQIKDMYCLLSRLGLASHYNSRAFSEFKGAFTGRDVVLLAAGPSVNDFKPIPDAIYIGMNRSFLYDKVQLDFLFAIDMLGIESFMDGFAEYCGNNCIKFIGDQNEGRGRDIPESYFLRLKNARKYKTDIFIDTGGKIPVDIDVLPVWNSNSIAHQAMQFALFGNPRRIYLVGCDCSGVQSGHFIAGASDDKMVGSFSDEFWNQSKNALINGWLQIREFAAVYYPGTEIISVNPVGLRGIFTDLDQKDEKNEA